MLKRLLVGLCTFLLVVSFTLISSGSAHAATCSGNGCDGKDPVKTQCNVGAVHLGIVRGTWEDGTDNYDNQVWWSNVCASNYGFVHSYNGQYLTTVAIYRADQPNMNCNAINQYGISPCTVNGGTCYGIGGCNTSTGGNALVYQAGGGAGSLYMNTNTTTWETDLLYAPSQQVQVCQLARYMGELYCSAWH